MATEAILDEIDTGTDTTQGEGDDEERKRQQRETCPRHAKRVLRRCVWKTDPFQEEVSRCFAASRTE